MINKKNLLVWTQKIILQSIKNPTKYILLFLPKKQIQTNSFLPKNSIKINKLPYLLI